jgi:hypothetical protein
MKFLTIDNLSSVKNIKWALSYMTVDKKCNEVVDKFKTFHNCQIFGCSSSLGVYTPDGFKRGAYFLVAEQTDDVDVYPVIKMTGELTAFSYAKTAALEIKNKFGNPDIILMHATPGYEERILEGIASVFGKEMPVYGGSAADDDLSGKWFVFNNITKVGAGFLLVGIKSKNVSGSFLSGYLHTQSSGVITKADKDSKTITRAGKRIIYEIDNKPAAVVYNEWTRGLISKYLETGGIILKETALSPLGRVVGKLMGMDLFLLSHPHMVIAHNKAISLFTEIKAGEKIWLMMGNKNSLIKKAREVGQKALLSGRRSVNGAILIYCGGVIANILDSVDIVIKEFEASINTKNFIGAATFGEQGYFKGINESHHGNLMADTIIF